MPGLSSGGPPPAKPLTRGPQNELNQAKTSGAADKAKLADAEARAAAAENNLEQTRREHNLEINRLSEQKNKAAEKHIAVRNVLKQALVRAESEAAAQTMKLEAESHAAKGQAQKFNEFMIKLDNKDRERLKYISQQAIYTKNLDTALKKAEAREAEQAAEIEKLTKDLAKEKEVAGGLILAEVHLHRERAQHLETKKAAEVNLAAERARADQIDSKYKVLVSDLDKEREEFQKGRELLVVEMKAFQAQKSAHEADQRNFELAVNELEDEWAELTAEQKDLEIGEDKLQFGQAKLSEDRAKLEDDQKALKDEKQRTEADISIMRKQLSDQYDEHVEQLRKRLGDKAQELEKKDADLGDVEKRLKEMAAGLDERQQGHDIWGQGLDEWEQGFDEREQRLDEREERIKMQERLAEDELKSDDGYDFVTEW